MNEEKRKRFHFQLFKNVFARLYVLLACLLTGSLISTNAQALDLGGMLKQGIDSTQQSQKQNNNTPPNIEPPTTTDKQVVNQMAPESSKTDSDAKNENADIEKAWSCSPQNSPNLGLGSHMGLVGSQNYQNGKGDRIYLHKNDKCKFSDQELARLATVMDDKYLLPEDQFHYRRVSVEFTNELKRQNGLKNEQQESFQKNIGAKENEEDNANKGILYLQPVKRNSTLDEAGLKHLLDTSDTLETSQMPSIAALNLGSDYSYAPMENCYIKKIQPYESQVNEDRYKRKAFVAFVECKLKYFKEERAFQKTADDAAHKKVEEIFRPRADEISSDDARSAVIEAFKALPRSKVQSTIQSIQVNLGMYYRNNKDFDIASKLERSLHSIKILLDIAKPEDVYRESKKIIIQSNQIWNPSRVIHLK